jgi:hypothetical protein
MVSSRVCAEVCVSRLTGFLNGFTINQKCMFCIIKLQNFEFATLSYQKVNTSFWFCKSIDFPHSATALYELNVC